MRFGGLIHTHGQEGVLEHEIVPTPSKYSSKDSRVHEGPIEEHLSVSLLVSRLTTRFSLEGLTAVPFTTPQFATLAF